MTILEVSDDGVLRVPGFMLPGASPHSRYVLEQVGDVTLLRPAEGAADASISSTPGERVDAFDRWVVAPRPVAPDLPEQSLRRENLYD